MNRYEPKFAGKRTKRLADLHKKIEPLKALRLKLLAEVNRLSFEHAVAGEKNGDKALAVLEVDQQKLVSLQREMEPIQSEINQLTRQFWVSKDQLKANKYELSASLYREVEQDQEYYEQPHITLERLRQLDTASTSTVVALKGMLGKP